MFILGKMAPRNPRSCRTKARSLWEVPSATAMFQHVMKPWHSPPSRHCIAPLELRKMSVILHQTFKWVIPPLSIVMPQKRKNLALTNSKCWCRIKPHCPYVFTRQKPHWQQWKVCLGINCGIWSMIRIKISQTLWALVTEADLYTVIQANWCLAE